MNDMEAKALAMGAVAFITLRKQDLAAAVENPSINLPVGEIVRFPRPYRKPSELPVFKDPRWADLHRPE